MAFSLGPGLTPPEIAFLCEMEMVTIVPRQRLERLELLGVRPTTRARVKQFNRRVWRAICSLHAFLNLTDAPMLTADYVSQCRVLHKPSVPRSEPSYLFG